MKQDDCPTGLRNQQDPEGNITQCYAISAVQVLLSIPRFRRCLEQLTQFSDALSRASNIVQALVILASALNHRRNHQRLFQAFMTAACYSGALHERYVAGENDSGDFLFALLTHLDHEGSIAEALRANVFDTATQFRLAATFQCSVCHHVWPQFRGNGVGFERHVVLPVSLFSGKGSSLDSALLHTTHPHEIEHVCNSASCGQRTRVVKTVEYKSAPDVLFVQIARPKGRLKSSPVTVSARVYLSVFEADFVLRAAAMHKGKSVDTGHYTSLASRGDQWYICDDNDVEATALEHALASQSFKSGVVLLAYERVNKAK